jgi:hypothetical protein
MILTFVFCLHLTGLTVADECWNREGGGQTVTGNYNYFSGWFPAFQYDPNNPEEIDRSSSEAISVIGGISPYTWSVSGNGFNLSQSQTTGLSNTLNADGTACGAATITVTDACGDTATGYVRCTKGSAWVQQCTDSGSRCAGDVSQTFYEYPDGQTRLTLTVGCQFCSAECECTYYTCGGYTAYVPTEHDGICYNPTYGNKNGRCSDCTEGNCECYIVGITVDKWECT